MYRKWFVIIFEITAVIIEQAENITLLKVTGIQCKSLDPKFLEVRLCEIKAVKRDVTETSVRVELFQKPVDNLTMHIEVKKRGYEHMKPILNVDFDACAFLRNKRRNPLAAIFYQYLGFEKYSNINHTCPYNHDVFFDKVRFDENGIEFVLIPMGHYIIYTTWYSLNVQRTQVDIKFQLIEK